MRANLTKSKKVNKKSHHIALAVLVLAVMTVMVVMFADIEWDEYKLSQEYLVTSQHQSPSGTIEFNQCIIDHTNTMTTEAFIAAALANIKDNSKTQVDATPTDVKVSFPCGGVTDDTKVETRMEIGSRPYAILSDLPYTLSYASFNRHK